MWPGNPRNNAETQNCAPRKKNIKKIHHSIKHIYRDYKILKFADILKVQNCLFMYQVE